jgi:hydroxymethylbilane synthase
LNDEATALCTKVEKDFLRVLMGGCSTPISALAQTDGDSVVFKGNICSTDGKDLVEVSNKVLITESSYLGEKMARQLLKDEKAQGIITAIRHAKR